MSEGGTKGALIFFASVCVYACVCVCAQYVREDGHMYVCEQISTQKSMHVCMYVYTHT